MIKQTLSAGLLAIVASFTFGTIAVHAEEIMPISERPVTSTDCVNSVDSETDTTTNCPDESADSTDSTTSVTEPTEREEDQKSDKEKEPEEIIVEEDEEVIEEETPMWPVYISLGALGLAILVFIVLNLFGGKRK